MTKHIALVLFAFLGSNIIISQTLKGKVYDANSTVEPIKVFNKTQKQITATDAKGEFSIAAKVGDSISFESLFYEPKVVVVESFHFDDIAVFEMKPKINTLDEVNITNTSRDTLFEEDTYNKELQSLIIEDIKNNQHKYLPEDAYANGGNILAVIGLVAKLFKRKNKYHNPTYLPMTYTQIDSLFTKNSFFNKRLLSENLEIPEDKHKLFFEFCAAKAISSALLENDKKMELLDEFVNNSELFLLLLEQYDTLNIKKE